MPAATWRCFSQNLPVGETAARHQPQGGIFLGRGQHRHLMGEEGDLDLAGGRHFQGVAQEAEAGDVGDGMRPPGLSRASAAGSRFRAVMTRMAAASASGEARRPFHGGGDDAGAQGLGEDQRIAHPGPGVGEHLVRMDHAGHRQAVFQLRIIDAVAAHQQGPGLMDLIQAAGQNRLEHLRGHGLQG